MQLDQAPVFTPGEEPLNRPPVGSSGVGVADGGQEEVKVTLKGPWLRELDGGRDTGLQSGGEITDYPHREHCVEFFAGAHDTAIWARTDTWPGGTSSRLDAGAHLTVGLGSWKGC